MPDLVADYIAEETRLLDFYAAPARSLFDAPPPSGNWPEDVAREMRRRDGGDTPLGNEPVVITGQQPGLFTGPLYTIYKAITALRAAERLSEKHGETCVPVFWVGGDDHDFEEVRSAHIRTRQHTVATLRYEPAEDVAGRSMYRVPAARNLHNLIDDAEAMARGSEHASDVAGFLHGSLDASSSFSDWMACLMTRLFEGTPLRVFAPDWPSARRAAAPVFARELEDPLATTKAVNEAGARLEALGYAAQVVKNDNECAFFLEVGQRRCKVLFEDGTFSLPEANATYGRDEMEAILAASPERFTANVALRCVVQQVLFPVAAYVAGPGELAYWAQLKEVFARHEQRMPIVYPRLRAVLTDTKLAKLLRKYDLHVADLDAPMDDLVERALRVSDTSPVLDTYNSEAPGVREAASQLALQLTRYGKAPGDLGASFERHLSEALRRLENNLLYLDQTRIATVRGHVERLTATLMPDRKPQERVLNVLSFLFEHGWDLVPRLVRDLDMDDFGLQEIEL